MLDKLTIKIETLEAKNEKMKGELETANTQIKNSQFIGGNKENEELEQNIAILTETNTIL